MHQMSFLIVDKSFTKSLLLTYAIDKNNGLCKMLLALVCTEVIQ